MRISPSTTPQLRVGFIVPALAEEYDLLLSCLDHLQGATHSLVTIRPHIVVLLQPSPGVLTPTVSRDGVDVLYLTERGVSRARNRGIDYLEGKVDAFMFVDVSVRPGAVFLTAAINQLSNAVLVTAPVAFAESPIEEKTVNVSSVSAAFLVFRGFVWSTLIRADALGALRFVEDIGPGTTSPHQAGEDSRLLYGIVIRNHIEQVPFLSCAVSRLPRPDLESKVKRYAFGQGYLVGQYLKYPVGGFMGFLYFLGRSFLFLLKSTLMLTSSSMRVTGKTRILSFWAGLQNKDKNAPSLVDEGGYRASEGVK